MVRRCTRLASTKVFNQMSVVMLCQTLRPNMLHLVRICGGATVVVICLWIALAVLAPVAPVVITRPKIATMSETLHSDSAPAGDHAKPITRLSTPQLIVAKPRHQHTEAQ
jgi:hypothetical protein